MSGIHQFTSSQWIQSGSEAQFKTGIDVTGSITATGNIIAGTFVGDGSNLTGIGDEDFFAGNPSEITDGTPSSKDSYLVLTTGQNTASASDIVIATTHSAGFTPNYYSFYKLTNNGFETIKSGSESFYSGSDRVSGGDSLGNDPFNNDFSPGVHRYMVNAVDTSTGTGHSIFTTITVEAFVNRPPEIVTPTNLNLFMGHDELSNDHILEFTGSSDPDTGDAIRRFETTRSTTDPTSDHTYNLLIKNSSGGSNGVSIATQSHNQGVQPVVPLSSDGLTITASIGSYDPKSSNVVILNQANRTESFYVTMSDNNLSENIASASFDVVVHAPPTASITNIKTFVEANAYTETSGNSCFKPMLYDRNVLPTSTSSLDSKYTSSLVRIQTSAKIQEPPGYTADSSHKTKIAIYSGSSSANIDSTNLVHWVQMDGHSGTDYTASKYGSGYATTTQATDANGWIPLALGVGSAFFGPQTSDASLLNITNGVRHGNRHHFSASSAGHSTIVITDIPDIEISNVKVQIESSSFSEIPTTTRTGSVLYGYTASLLQEHTASLTGDKSEQYISESVIRYRVLARIQEPFGPDHKPTDVNIESGGTTINSMSFSTSSAHVYSSSSNYDASNRLVTDYTSSWFSSSFIPGSYTISASFAKTAVYADQTVTAGTYANLLINQTESIQVNNVKVQIESSSFSQIPTYSRTGSLLYGHDQTLLQEQTASLLGLDREVQYISESVIRYRVLAKVQEPFGPYDEKTLVTLTGGSTSHNIDFDTPDTESFDASHRRISNYTSSWYSSSFVDGAYDFTASFATYSLAADLTAAQGQYSSLLINNTASTQIDNIEVELETAYGTETATHERTSRILYGFTSSLKSTETASLIGYTKENEYISESVIRYRVRAKVVEPFGPETTDIVSSISMGGSGGGGSKSYPLPLESAWSTNWSTSNVATNYYSNANINGATHEWDGPSNLDSGGTPSNGTGPYDGLTATQTSSVAESQTDTEPFIFTEGSGNANEVFVFRTPRFNLGSTSNNKLHLYYHAYGSDIGPFTIHIGEDSADITTATALTFDYSTNGTSLNQTGVTSIPAGEVQQGYGEDWLKIECDLSGVSNQSNDKYIYFKHIPPDTHEGDFSIDNVWIEGTSGGGGSTETLTFTTGSSADIATTGSEAYTADHQRILNYTSSWQEYNFDSNINLSSSFSTTENVLTVGTGVTSSLTIVPTVAPIIYSTMSYEAKWTGETPSDTDTTSRSARILYGYSDTFLSASLDGAGGLRSQVNYRVTHSTDAVIRHRIKAKVVEPFGPHTTTFTIDPAHKLSGETITLSTASANTDVYATSSDYETSTDKFIIYYTSSWFEKDYTAASYTQNYSISSTPTAESTESASPTLVVTSPDNPTITAVVEVEQTNSGSGVAGSNRTATFVHGNPAEQTTVTDPANQSSWPIAAQNEMVRARVRAHVQETFGPKADTFSTTFMGGAARVGNTVTTVLNSGSSSIFGISSPTVNHSETNGRFAYEFTSAFTPVQLTSTNTNVIQINNFSDTFTTSPSTIYNNAFVSMNARQTSSIDFVSLVTSSDFSSSAGVTMPHPYVVPGYVTNLTDLGITATTTHTPPPISIYSSLSDAVSTVAYLVTSGTNASANSNGRNGHVDFTSIDTYPEPNIITVTGTVTSTIIGDTNQSNTNNITIMCLTQPPVTMSGQYFAAHGASNHDYKENTTSPVLIDVGVDLKHGGLFSGILPSSSAWAYSASQSPGDSVSNVFIVNDTNGSNTDYGIYAKTPAGVYGYGDQGALTVKVGNADGYINGNNNIAATFDSSLSNGTQSFTANIGVAPQLGEITTKVFPFKNTSQSFYNGSEHFPNGYQSFQVIVNLNIGGIPDGYRYFRLSHQISSKGFDDSLNPVELYYDQYKPTDFNNAPASWSWTPYNGSEPTLSLSGVSYFKDNVEFEISYSEAIINLANDTYQSVTNLGTVNPDYSLKINDGTGFSDVTKTINPGVNLFWSSHDSTDPSIPEIGATASLAYRAKYTGASTSVANKSATISINKRNLSSGINTPTGISPASQPTVGRFVNDSTIVANPDSDTVARFYEETRRIPSSSNLNTLLAASQADYEYWLTSSNYTYDSTQSLTTNSELQQTVEGHLIYPNANYTGSNIFNPNAPDYTSATGDRYWYRAIKVQGISGTGDRLIKIKMGMPNTNATDSRRDIWAADPEGDGETVGFDTRDIRIRCKMPGPINSSGNQGSSFPGTGWSAVCGRSGTQTAYNLDNWFQGNNASYNYSNGYVSINWNTGQYAIDRSSQVAIVEIRLKPTATESRHVITSIELEDVD